MSSKSDPFAVSSNNSQYANGSSKEDKKSKNFCELCKVPVTSKNLPDHYKGKKHKNNLKKDKLKKSCKPPTHVIYKEKKAEETKISSYPKSTFLASLENESDCSILTSEELNEPSPEEENRVTLKKRTLLKTPSTKSIENTTLPEVSPTSEQQCSNVHVNGDMSNQNNIKTLQSRHRYESDCEQRKRHTESTYYENNKNSGHRRRTHQQSLRGNFSLFENQNSGWQSWQERYSPNWHQMNRYQWSAPYKKQDSRYFHKPCSDSRSNDENPFFVDAIGSYDTVNSNENYFSFHKTNPADLPLGNITPEVVTKKPSSESSTPSVNEKQSTKTVKSKPLKRQNQNVRAITLACRSSVDSDDALQEGSGDRQEKKNENATGKRIANWINPSNPKDEAEVRRLVTEFSKSKKKENLLKLQQQSDNRTERRISISADEMSPNLEQDNSGLDSSIEIIHESAIHTESQTSVNLTVKSPSFSPSISKPSQKRKISLLKSGASSRSTVNEVKKRKSISEQSLSKTKKTTSATEIEACLDAVIRGSYDSLPPTEPSGESRKINSNPEIPITQTKELLVKKEPVYSLEENPVQSFTNSLNLDEFLQTQLGVDNSASLEATMTPVESLINLFASGNVKVKKEFDDPLIDAIRTVDPAVLNKVCETQSNTTMKSNPPADKSTGFPSNSVAGSLKAILKELQKISDREQKVKESLQEADLKIQEYQRLLDEWKTKKIKFQSEEEYLGHQRNSLVKSMNDLVTDENTAVDIKEGSKLVETTPCNFFIVNSTANNHSNLLNNVSTAEMQPNNQPISLLPATNKQPVRASTPQIVENFPVQPNAPTPLIPAANKQPVRVPTPQNVENIIVQPNTSTALIPAVNKQPVRVSTPQTIGNFPVRPTADEEVAILPVPSRFIKKEVEVIDLDEEPEGDSTSNIPKLSKKANLVCSDNVSSTDIPRNISSLLNCLNAAGHFVSNTLSQTLEYDQRASISFEGINASASNDSMLRGDIVNEKLSRWDVLTAHQSVINSIQVFGDYLYTCSNDGTAKRFHIKDLSQIVTYQHEKKNVIHMCVDKMNGTTLVFTVCAASNCISVFKAEDGTVLNTFTFTSNVASICKGKDKIYVGLRDGYIFTCNQKEQKEIVYTGDSIRSIALTYQGCISILVILAVNGCVSIRDAERNGLLIRTVKPQRNVPLFMSVHADCIYLSGSGALIVVEIGTARCVRQYDLSAPYTSLTVYQGNIFTTSYSGLVRCYPNNLGKEVTVYYGAGNAALTCISVFNGWVLTGNRFGAVDVFKFDPDTYLPCQLGKCDLIFSRLKDLEVHAFLGSDHDLPSAGSKCPWRSCRQKIHRNSSSEAIKCHIKEHIQASTFQDNQTFYNIAL